MDEFEMMLWRESDKGLIYYTGQNGETICARVEDIAAMGVDKAIEVMGSNACNTDTGQA